MGEIIKHNILYPQSVLSTRVISPDCRVFLWSHEMETKTCTVCEETKPATLEFFHKQKGGKYGLQAKCKVCSAEKYREKNPIVLVYEFPASKVCSCCKKEFPANAEFFHKQKGGKYGLMSWCKVCKAKYSAKYDQIPKVKQRHNERKRKRDKERRKTDTQYKLKKNLRKRLRDALQGNSKSAPTLKLLGCTVEYLKNHLESQFTEGMGWDNYGFYGWHIDHIIPIDSFDLTDPAQQRECFHFSNLQPLWAEDNLIKGSSIPAVLDRF